MSFSLSTTTQLLVATTNTSLKFMTFISELGIGLIGPGMSNTILKLLEIY